MKNTDKHYSTIKAVIGAKDLNKDQFWQSAECLDELDYDLPVEYQDPDIIQIEEI